MDKFSKKIGDCQNLAFSINNALGSGMPTEMIPALPDQNPAAIVPPIDVEQLKEQFRTKEKEELKVFQGILEDSVKMQVEQEENMRKICAKIDMQSEKYLKIEKALSMLATMPDEIEKIKESMLNPTPGIDLSELQTKMNERMEDLEKKYRSIKFSPKKPELEELQEKVEEKEPVKKAEKPVKQKKKDVPEDNIDAK